MRIKREWSYIKWYKTVDLPFWLHWFYNCRYNTFRMSAKDICLKQLDSSSIEECEMYILWIIDTYQFIEWTLSEIWFWFLSKE